MTQKTYPSTTTSDNGDLFKRMYKSYQQNYQYKPKTEEWTLPKTGHEEINIKKDADGRITGPWSDVLKAYENLTEHDEPECSECELEMFHGDRTFICPSCNKKYQVGAHGEDIIVFRDDVSEGYVEKTEIPDSYFDTFVYQGGGVDLSAATQNITVTAGRSMGKSDMKAIQKSMEKMRKHNYGLTIKNNENE